MTDTSTATAGGAGAAADATAGAAGAAAPTPADAAAAAAAGGATAGQQQAAADATATSEGQQAGAEGNPWENPERARLEIERLRRENGDQRINAKNQAAQDGARKALAEAAKLAGLEIPGLTDADEGAADPKQLAQQITDATARGAAAEAELAVTRTAWGLGVNPDKVDLLQALLSRSPEFKTLDPTAGDYQAKLAAAIAAQVAKEPTLKLTGSVAASGPDQFGGANGSTAITKATFDGMSLAEKSTLRNTDRATYDKLVAG